MHGDLTKKCGRHKHQSLLNNQYSTAIEEIKSMNEILALEQELLKGNFNEACDLVNQIKTMSRQDRINQLETYLALVISQTIVILISSPVDFSTVKKLRNYLIEIKQYNRLGTGVYIEDDEWTTHYNDSLELGILKALDSGLLPEGMGIEKLRENLDFRILQIEVLSLIDLTNSLNACELDSYLRFRFTAAVSPRAMGA